MYENEEVMIRESPGFGGHTKPSTPDIVVALVVLVTTIVCSFRRALHQREELKVQALNWKEIDCEGAFFYSEIFMAGVPRALWRCDRLLFERLCSLQFVAARDARVCNRPPSYLTVQK
ncbi:hypothetical protein EVAR_6231_1 [Eumeta japonica]|uniref:Uncharacterized protein n=1 Tax=Eumeta variegata TaxID=151549 RepID=A0A4C1TBH3_EUMVA|nr:hypothetical protein EVAR_6231_1 [Eumeta japonica]